MTTRNDLLDAARRATEVIADFHLKDRINDGYTRIDPALLASMAEVTVMYKSLDKLLGGFLREGDSPGILVNVARPRGLIHMTCAHELGHYFLGHESSADETVDFGTHADIKERQANHFAYSLLAPQWLVASIMRLKGWTRTDLEVPSVVYQLSLRLGTSYTATVWSLVRCKLLQHSAADSLLSQPPKGLKQSLLDGRTLSDANADVWQLDISDRDRILEPGYGDLFVLDLPNHAGSGHLWSVDELSSEGFTLRPFVRDARIHSRQQNSEHPVGGGKSTIRYLLETPESFERSESESDERSRPAQRRQLISMQEKSPWSTSPSRIDRFSVSAEFEQMRGGLSTAEKDLRLATVRDMK
ncbi:Domain of uncharacterised function (DUF955) [Burkholderia pseudomallei]|uniref:ImmA/IrrE family metallo-endopeptidase n=1 Tax=Burkholderia pseudomallei TaxID=28450 RepID=UPI000F097D91|nr:ImmA/IrrE family metallo-endopeptidase [Burkholderia pseudomallei]CAJ3147701.1 Domain of uncharacterised function (DUF955) [Burkholderia pseudomallei]VCN38409.1 Domain of uncharacterised function (DUF955) [Burkholderia pseudomallei]VCN49723.1 Domain of uncharacterised function (DUF955) [Burkholderia pseudomallei]VCN64790.1 Domain of uncharacterised function (DUF955) [Burkholderia pseudomallei]VCN69692.1 Domain of uncharacterised function (DUF955) [Burkholderia pseudomallei]